MRPFGRLRTLGKGRHVAAEYRYQHFTTKLLFHDLGFHRGSKRPGDTLPEFDLPTTGSERIATKDLVDDQPLLLVTGSMTCPMTASAIPSMKRLHARYGDDVAFVMLNVREAHPGENYPQSETLEEKADHARALKETYQMPWTVAVDDLDGSLHIAMDAKPNSAYLLDRDGTIVFRSIWARDEDSIGAALENVKRDETPAKTESRAMVGPLVSAMGSVHEVMKRAGPQAERDHWLANPPMELAGRVASLFPSLSPDRRGVAAVATLGTATVFVLVALFLVFL